jgi:xanthine/CO dehydrogenase XdhC/CoxF family maturation factor
VGERGEVVSKVNPVHDALRDEVAALAAQAGYLVEIERRVTGDPRLEGPCRGVIDVVIETWANEPLAIVEVKQNITTGSAKGKVARQVRRYRQIVGSQYWTVVVADIFTDSVRDALRRDAIDLVTLDGFRTWVLRSLKVRASSKPSRRLEVAS